MRVAVWHGGVADRSGRRKDLQCRDPRSVKVACSTASLPRRLC